MDDAQLITVISNLIQNNGAIVGLAVLYLWNEKNKKNKDPDGLEHREKSREKIQIIEDKQTTIYDRQTTIFDKIDDIQKTLHCIERELDYKRRGSYDP